MLLYSNLRKLLTLELSSLCNTSVDLAITVGQCEGEEAYRAKFPIKEIKELYIGVSDEYTKAVLNIAVTYYYDKKIDASYNKAIGIVYNNLKLDSKLYTPEDSYYTYLKESTKDLDMSKVKSLSETLCRLLQGNPVTVDFIEDLKRAKYNFVEVFPKYKYVLGQMNLFVLNRESIKVMLEIYEELSLEEPCWIIVAHRRLAEFNR